ncbi:MAG: dihydrofolate reductase family protein [Streptosporangiaceae bacterium]|nr:dihydrofolate reductase family protein [Streptosporangiaceae bacterium]MBV9855265.1 dihydrofolate reductase family protein [Streptosporangiaceae bacterium]
MSRRPYTLLSCAVSADGCLDDASGERLVLSGAEDLDRVDELRAGCDAILVGAGTIRADDPRLLIRSPGRRDRRAARGLPPHPLRVTLTASGGLDPAARFFTGPGGPPLVYCATPAAGALRARLGEAAVVMDAGDPASLRAVLSDLTERGVARLLVEGGSQVLREALTGDLADELHLAVAPFFVGDAAAPRFGLPGAYPHTVADPMTPAEVRRAGPVALLHYLLGPGGADRRFLRWAVELSRLCPPSATAFSVGAVVVSSSGEVLSTGYSREQQDHDHAEEVALRKLGSALPQRALPPAAAPLPAAAPPGAVSPGAASHPPDPRLRGATLYSSLVPCGARASRPVTCVQHILAAGIPRVVFAWREPELFTAGEGAGQLRAAGVEVIEIPALAPEAAAVNAHLVAQD